MQPDPISDEGCDACPSVLPSVALAAGGAALLAWLFGRNLYKRDLVRAVIRAQQAGSDVVRLPEDLW